MQGVGNRAKDGNGLGSQLSLVSPVAAKELPFVRSVASAAASGCVAQTRKDPDRVILVSPRNPGFPFRMCLFPGRMYDFPAER